MIEGWSGHYNEASVRKYFPGDAATAQAYGKSLGSPESVLRSLFSLLPSYRYKNTIHELLYTRLVGSSRGPGNTAEVPTEVSGFLPVDSPVTADEIGQLVRGDKATVTTTDIFLPLAENIELLNALCRVARDHHTPLIVSSSPVMTAHLLNPYYQAAVDKAEQVLRADLTTQPGCTWHDAPYWDQRLFHDPQHLNATGAALFGRQLGTYYLQDVAR